MSQEFININEVNIPVIFEKDERLPIASMQLIFLNSGSIKDDGVSGLVRFVSKMLSEGTKEMSSTDFAQALEEKAVNFSVSAGTETLTFELSSLSEDFEFGMQMLEKVLSAPNLSKEAYKKVYAQTKGTILDKQSDFDYLANLKLRSLMYENSPFSLPFLGTQESVENITVKMVENFLKNHLNLSNLVIVAGGDIELKSFKENLPKLLSKLQTGKQTELPYYDVSNSQKKDIQIKQSEQAYIYFASPFYLKADDKDNYIAKVASFILGEGGFGSRLMEEIRVKRGLAYSAYSKLSIEKSGSAFTGHLQTKSESENEAIEIVKEVIKEFTQKGVTQKELNQAKRFLLGSEPLRVETLSQRLSRSFLEYYKGLGFGYFKTELENIEALSLEDLNRFIKSHKEINELIFSILTNDNTQKP